MKDIAISLCAIDRIINQSNVKADDEEDHNQMNENDENKSKNTPIKKTLRGAWFKWAMEHHSFSDIKLKPTGMRCFY